MHCRSAFEFLAIILIIKQKKIVTFVILFDIIIQFSTTIKLCLQ